MDGRLLALATRKKRAIQEENRAEDDRRHRVAYKRVPRLREIDARLAQLVREFAQAILGGPQTTEEIRREAETLQAERVELLTGQGWPGGWLDGVYTCPRCRDYGYANGQMCQCLRELYEAERRSDLTLLLKTGDERFDSFDLTYYDDAPLPGATRSPRAQMELIFRFCREYAEDFGAASKNLLLHGGTGLGKTFLSACIAREVSDRGFSVVYETTVAALAAFETQKFRPTEEAEAAVDRLLGCELLVLDDLGTEMVTEFTKSALYTLVNTRLMNTRDARKTIISTNLSPEALARTYTPQLCSRLLGEYQLLPFAGQDIRQLKKERGL